MGSESLEGFIDALHSASFPEICRLSLLGLLGGALDPSDLLCPETAKLRGISANRIPEDLEEVLYIFSAVFSWSLLYPPQESVSVELSSQRKKSEELGEPELVRLE